MRLLRLRMTNFASVKATQTLELSGRGIVLVVGDNGSGKTTIPNAITWCLFGKTTRGEAKDGGASGDDVVNEAVNKDCHVQVLFEDGAGETWKVDRYRKHHVEKNKLYLLAESGTDRTQHMTEETEREIVKLLGLDFTAFMTAVVFGQGMLAPFSAMKPKEQSEVIDTIIGTHILQEATDIARERRKLVRDELSDAESEIEREQQRLKEMGDELKELERERKKLLKQRKKRMKRLTIELNDALARHKAAQTEVAEVSKHNKQATKARRDLYVLRDREKALLRRYSLKQAEHEDLEEDAASYKKKLKEAGFTCMECGGKITKANVLARIEELTVQAKGAQETSKLLHVELERVKKLVSTTEAELTSLERRARPTLDVNETARAVSRAKQHLLDAGEEQRNLDLGVTMAQKRIKRSQTKLEELELTRTKAERRLLYVEWCEKQFNEDIRLDVQETMLPFLNEKAAAASGMITQGEVDVTFATTKTNKGGNTKDTFTVTANNARGAKVYKLQSRGERQKVDIIVARALQALSRELSKARVNFTIFDEPFDGLTVAATERVVEFIQEELRNAESVFVITHNEALKAYFSEVILVEKTNNATTFSIDS